MKCLVFSDSHGSSRYIERAIVLHRDAEVIFFLGDGVADVAPLISKYNTISWLAVRGNCDSFFNPLASEAPTSGIITIEGKRIYYSHGDIHGVKGGMDSAESFAENNCVDIFLFGHTHVPYERYHDGIYYFNPGSIKGSYSFPPSYGVMQISEQGVLFSHGSFV